ncbi:unnamed protein product, partial [Menidia menidia]
AFSQVLGVAAEALAGGLNVLLQHTSQFLHAAGLQLCLAVSGASALLSVVAIIIYSVDMEKNPELPCDSLSLTPAGPPTPTTLLPSGRN